MVPASTSPWIRLMHAASIAALAVAGCHVLGISSSWASVPPLMAATAIAAWRSGCAPALAATVATALWLMQMPLEMPAWLSAMPGGHGAAAAYLVIVLPALAIYESRRRKKQLEHATRRDADEALAVQQEAANPWRAKYGQLSEALAAAGLCAWEWDLDTGLVTVTAHGEALGGSGGMPVQRAQLHVDECLERVHPDDRAALQRVLHQALAHDRAHAVQCRVVDGDRAATWLQAHGKLVRDVNGSPSKMYGVVQEINERKRAEEAQLESERCKDQFLAIVGHELRNPLNPMSAALEVLREKGDDEQTRAWARLLIERQVRHLARLLDDLLDVSRLSHGKFALRREAVDICSVIGAAIDHVRADIDGKRQRVEFHVGRLEPVYVDGDAVRLTQIVSNLVTNAMKYSAAGSTITVRVEAAGERVEMTVADTGIGIPQEDLERVFDLFAQSSAGSKFSGDGLGIGLYLVRGLVEMHGGQITAHSAGVGKGSTFRVMLPRADAPRNSDDGRHTCPEEHINGPLRVVVADDNADSVDTLQMLLRLQGHEVHTARHGGEAAELIAEHRPHVAVLDIGMPVMNGYEVAQRAREEVPEVVLIALSGWGNSDDVARAMQAGFDHHVVKPADFARLERLITRVRGPRHEHAGNPQRELAADQR